MIYFIAETDLVSVVCTVLAPVNTGLVDAEMA